MHPDIYYAQPEKKSQIYSIEQMRDIIENASIRPNEADIKILCLKVQIQGFRLWYKIHFEVA